MSNTASNGPNESKIDEGLYSRQLYEAVFFVSFLFILVSLFSLVTTFAFSLAFLRYVLGHEAMRRLGSSAVMVAGMGGLGVEVAKNVTLAGVGQLVLQDTQPATLEDLATNFFLTEKDVKEKRNRAEAVLQQIASLNSYVRVSANTSPLTKELVKTCSVRSLVFHCWNFTCCCFMLSANPLTRFLSARILTGCDRDKSWRPTR